MGWYKTSQHGLDKRIMNWSRIKTLLMEGLNIKNQIYEIAQAGGGGRPNFHNFFRKNKCIIYLEKLRL